MAIYTCVLLDVDNTLLDFDAAERQALTDMLTEYELPHDARACEIYHAVNRELWDALAKGQLTKPKLFQQRFGRFMKAMDLPDNGKAVQMNDRYEELLSTPRCADRTGGTERGRHSGHRLQWRGHGAGGPHPGFRH